MGDRMLLWVVAATVIGVVIAILARKSQEMSKPQGEEKQHKGESWLGQIHNIWWALGIAIGGLKYVYKAWKAAPVGSAAKFGWSAVLALIAAIGLFALVKLLDNKLNPPKNENEIEEQRNRLPTTFTRAPVTEKWEYKR